MVDILRMQRLYFNKLFAIYKSIILINVTLRQLICFQEVARARSFTGAAARMHTSQSTLSTAIRDLEDAIGARLIERTTKRFELTEIGSEFLPAVGKVVDDLQRAIESASSTSLLQKGVLTVGATPLLAGSLLAHLVGEFNKCHPGLNIRLYDSATDSLTKLLRSREIELALGAFDESDKDFIITPLFVDRLVALAHPNLKAQSPCSWKALTRMPLVSISRQGSVGRLIEKTVWNVAKVNYQPIVEVANWTTVISLTQALEAVCIVPRYAADHLQASARNQNLVQLELVRPQVDRCISVAHSTSYELSPAARNFLDVLRSKSTWP